MYNNPYLNTYQNYMSYPQFQQQNVDNRLVQNPYVMSQQYQQQVQPQQQGMMQSPFIKFVDSAEVVKATDIPMDGNTYYFPKPDGTEMYAKRWLQNGTTEVITYVPMNTQVAKTKEDTFKTEVMQKLNDIENRFAKFEKSLSQKPSVKTVKKEGEVND